MLASATEIVCALGQQDQLVGISHECDYPPEVLHLPRLSRPRFDPSGKSSAEVDRAVRTAMSEHGSVYEIDEEALTALMPDLILTQAVCEVCAVPTPGVRELVERRSLPAQVLSLDTHTVGEILDSILQVGAAIGVTERAATFVQQLRDRMARVQQRKRGQPRPRVLAIEWLDPPFVPGHWVPEMILLAGGVNLVGDAGAHSRQVDWSELQAHDPDVLIVMPCGYGLDASHADADRHREALERVAARAIREHRAYVVDGSSYFNRSGPRFIDGIEILDALLAAAPGPPPAGAARWPD